MRVTVGGTYGVARLETSLVIYKTISKVNQNTILCQSCAETYHIDATVSCDSNNRVQAAKINTDDRHLDLLLCFCESEGEGR